MALLRARKVVKANLRPVVRPCGQFTKIIQISVPGPCSQSCKKAAGAGGFCSQKWSGSVPENIVQKMAGHVSRPFARQSNKTPPQDFLKII
jgi:hypothetical protein